MKIDLTNTQWSDIKLCLLMAISHTEKSSLIKFEDNPLIKRYLKTHDEIAVAMENEKKKQEKAESDPYDPRRVKYYASKGFYQQLHAFLLPRCGHC